MIIGSCKSLYLPPELMNDNWKRAFEWLAGEGWKGMPVGRLEIAGSGVYATRTVSQTKPFKETSYESHRRYADIQIVLEGSEIIMVGGREGLKTTAPYDPGRDVELFEGNPSVFHQIVLNIPLLAAVFFPADAHRPVIAPEDRPSMVDKLVVKVCLD